MRNAIRGCGCHVRAIPTKGAFEFVEYAVVLVQVAKLAAQMVVYVNRPHWAALHVDIPDLKGQVVT